MRGQVPLFVCEGTSDQKLDQIKKRQYLLTCFEKLSTLDGSMFIFGHSGGESDRHIFRQIAASSITKVFVSIHSSSSPRMMHWEAWAATMKADRKSRFDLPPLDVAFFFADSAGLWKVPFTSKEVNNEADLLLCSRCQQSERLSDSDLCSYCQQI
jgi:hypothetical protein